MELGSELEKVSVLWSAEELESLLVQVSETVLDRLSDKVLDMEWELGLDPVSDLALDLPWDAVSNTVGDMELNIASQAPISCAAA